MQRVSFGVLSVLVAIAATLALVGGRPPPAAAAPPCADKPDGWPCADGDVCTAGDWCQSGVCVARECALGKVCGAACLSTLYCGEGGGSCPCTASVPRRFVNNGDGTVTDTQTGLMWEKKTDDESVHDVDNQYTLSDLGDGDNTDPDGTVFTEFLDELNKCMTADGATITGGFAGYCDWRVPGIVELQTIVDPTQGYCGGGSGACIHPIFGPTQNWSYWSSTTIGDAPHGAWLVDFGHGSLVGDYKDIDHYVRAVRGGW